MVGNCTLKVLQAINLIYILLDVKVIIGASNPHYESIKQESERCRHYIKILTDVDHMAQLMAWADMAVAAGGSTCWELAFMGVPNLIIVLAENQQCVAEGLDAEGVAIKLGWHNYVTEAGMVQTLQNLILDAERRSRMSERGRQLLDGKGSQRIVRFLRFYEQQGGNSWYTQ